MYLPTKPSFNVDSPAQPAAQHSGRAHCYKKLIRRHGRIGNHSLKLRLLPLAVVLPKYLLNNRADHISMVIDYQN